MKELTHKQKRFGLNNKKYYVTRDRHSDYWIVFLPLDPFPEEQKIVHRFITHGTCITFINERERRLNAET